MKESKPAETQQLPRLDRHLNADGLCKYALIKLRDVRKDTEGGDVELKEQVLLQWLGDDSHINFGDNSEIEFFVVFCRDKYAAPALAAYAKAAIDDGEELLGRDVLALSHRAEKHPSKRKPT